MHTAYCNSKATSTSSTMKYIIALCLFGVALALPQFKGDDKTAKIISQSLTAPEGANFNSAFQSENGIEKEKIGTTGEKGQSNMSGFFRFPLPDGTIAEFRYVADELGYRVESPLIPTPHPLPEHAIEQIRFAEEQRARGVQN